MLVIPTRLTSLIQTKKQLLFNCLPNIIKEINDILMIINKNRKYIIW